MAAEYECLKCGYTSETSGECPVCGTKRIPVDIDKKELPHNGSDVDTLTM